MKLNILFIFALIVVAIVVGAKGVELTTEEKNQVCNNACSDVGTAEEIAECQEACHAPDNKSDLMPDDIPWP